MYDTLLKHLQGKHPQQSHAGGSSKRVTGGVLTSSNAPKVREQKVRMGDGEDKLVPDGVKLSANFRQNNWPVSTARLRVGQRNGGKPSRYTLRSARGPIATSKNPQALRQMAEGSAWPFKDET